MREEKRAGMSLDLIKTFTGAMESLGKEAIVRTWVVGSLMEKLPRELDYATKYSVFDACWAGPDPVVNPWLAAGHRMWETVAIEAENCGPVVWHDEQWCRETARRINRLAVQGCIIHINTQWGHTGHIAALTSALNITRLLESLSPEVAGGSSEKDYRGLFGDQAGAAVCRAAQLIATFPLHMTGVVHLAREGFSYGMPPWFDGPWRWPGVLGSPRYAPEKWANPDGLVTIYELVQAAAASPESYQDIIKAPAGNAIGRCDEIAAWCRQAQALLASCPAPASPRAGSELKVLAASAHLAEQAACEHGAILRARVAWEAFKHLPAGSAAAGAARRAAAQWYQKGLAALEAQIPWAMELARVYPDAMNHVVESHETFNRLTMATRVRIRREELERIMTVAGPDWEAKMKVSFWPHLPHTIGSHACAPG